MKSQPELQCRMSCDTRYGRLWGSRAGSRAHTPQAQHASLTAPVELPAALPLPPFSQRYLARPLFSFVPRRQDGRSTCTQHSKSCLHTTFEEPMRHDMMAKSIAVDHLPLSALHRTTAKHRVPQRTPTLSKTTGWLGVLLPCPTVIPPGCSPHLACVPWLLYSIRSPCSCLRLHRPDASLPPMDAR